MPLVSLHTSNILTSQVNYSRQLGYLCCCLWDIFQALIIPPPPPPTHTHTFIISTAPSFHQFSRPWEKGAFSHPHPLPPPSGLSSSHTLCFTCVQGKDWRMKLTQRMGSWKSVALMKRRRRSPWTSDFSVPVPPPPPSTPGHGSAQAAGFSFACYSHQRLGVLLLVTEKGRMSFQHYVLQQLWRLEPGLCLQFQCMFETVCVKPVRITAH